MTQLGNSICLSSKLKCKKVREKKKNIQIYSENKKEMKNWKILPLYLGDQNEKFECFLGRIGTMGDFLGEIWWVKIYIKFCINHCLV